MFDWAHIHVMIVHLPIIGTALAMIPLLWGVYKKDISMKWIGLVILAISLLGIPIATTSGESTEHAFFNGTMTAQIDDPGVTALAIHANAADYAATLGYFVLALIVLQLILWKKDYKGKNTLFYSTLVINALLICGLGYVGYLGGKIRHPEFRTPAQTTTQLQTSIVAQ